MKLRTYRAQFIGIGTINNINMMYKSVLSKKGSIGIPIAFNFFPKYIYFGDVISDNHIKLITNLREKKKHRNRVFIYIRSISLLLVSFFQHDPFLSCQFFDLDRLITKHGFGSYNSKFIQKIR